MMVTLVFMIEPLEKFRVGGFIVMGAKSLNGVFSEWGSGGKLFRWGWCYNRC